MLCFIIVVFVIFLCSFVATNFYVLHVPDSATVLANPLKVQSKIKVHFKLLCLVLLYSYVLSLRFFDILCEAFVAALYKISVLN